MERKGSRSKYELYIEILKATPEGRGRAKKTRIMHDAYLDWRNFRRYFSFLIEHGFIGNNNNPEGYFLTNSGRELLQKLEEVKRMLDSKH